MLAHVGFRCVVMDDREAFANPQVFLQAERTVVGDMEHISDYVDIRSRDYVCVMTRGHQFDYYVQKQAMALHPYYIGIMGSRNKIRVVTDKLLADGFSLEEIQKCHMPIGTDIGAETPAEIAISLSLIHIFGNSSSVFFNFIHFLAHYFVLFVFHPLAYGLTRNI